MISSIIPQLRNTSKVIMHAFFVLEFRQWE